MGALTIDDSIPPESDTIYYEILFTDHIYEPLLLYILMLLDPLYNMG